MLAKNPDVVSFRRPAKAVTWRRKTTTGLAVGMDNQKVRGSVVRGNLKEAGGKQEKEHEEKRISEVF